MVFVTYDNTDKKFKVEDISATLLHATPQGGYCFTPIAQENIAHSFSRYCGYHKLIQNNLGWDQVKFIHSFLPFAKPLSVTKNVAGASLEYKDATLSYIVSDEAIELTTTNQLTIPLTLDCKEIYDFDSEGREFVFEQTDKYTLITYKKHAGENFDAPLQQFKESDKPYLCFIAINKQATVQKRDDWMLTHYELEHKRNAGQTQGYIYHSCDVTLPPKSKVRIAFGFTKEECLKNLQIKTLTTHRNPVLTKELVNETDIALTQAIESYSQLIVTPKNNKTGLYAGLPWFFQYWSRDEAISCAGLTTLTEYKLVKDILFRELSTVTENGQIANRFPHSELPSADATGWMAKRFLDLLIQQPRVFTKKELNSLYGSITDIVIKQESNLLANGFIESQPLETWMDTGRGYDERVGSRIEIQALHLQLLRLQKTLAHVLDKDTYRQFKNEEETFAQNVRAAFLSDNILCDGIYPDGNRDKTIRPNIFLAHYLYPNLLTKEQWESVFDNALSALFMDWGGLSTIDKSNPLYKTHHTGQTNESYHRGDSWFWVNNLAALCLKRLNDEKYAPFIDKIISASTSEILQHGALGCHAEISDSVQLTSLGCYNQLWSNALFIELLHER